MRNQVAFHTVTFLPLGVFLLWRAYETLLLCYRRRRAGSFNGGWAFISLGVGMLWLLTGYACLAIAFATFP